MLYRPRKNKKPPTVCVAVLKGIYHYRFLLGVSIHFFLILPLISHIYQCEKKYCISRILCAFLIQKCPLLLQKCKSFFNQGYLFCPMLWYSCIEHLNKNDWLCTIQSTTVPTKCQLVGTFIFPCVNYNCHNNTNQMILWKNNTLFLLKYTPAYKRGFFLIFPGFF